MATHQLASRPIPVLMMVRELHLGGSERQLTEVAKALDRQRFEPHVGCFRPNGIRGDELRAAGVPVVEFPVRSFRRPSVVAAARQLGRYIRQHRIQLVHTFDVPTALFGVPITRMLSTAVVLASQRAHRELTPGLTHRLLRLTDHLVDGIVVNCDSVRRQLIHDDNVPEHLIHICYNGIDIRRFSPLTGSRRRELEGATLVIGIVAALRPEKDFETLLRAFAEVRQAHRGVKLAIVGSGPLHDELLATASALGIAESCVFAPATAEVAEWLRSLDIFVLPSKSEALSNALMEAMACGCAVVASRVGGNPELVQGGQNGLLFDCGDAGALARCLRQLTEHPTLRRRLGEAAAEAVRARFSLAESVRQMTDIYTGAMTQHGSAERRCALTR